MSDREKNWWAGGGTGQQKGNEVPFSKRSVSIPLRAPPPAQSSGPACGVVCSQVCTHTCTNT